MDKELIKRRINRVFYGALVWAVFYFYVFYDRDVWNKQTLLGSEMYFSYSLEFAYIIKIAFFTLIGFNLYKTTLGKSKGIFTYNRLLNVLILAAIVSLVIQFITYNFYEEYAFKGFLGYFYNSDSPFIRNQTFFLMMVGNMVELLYMSMILIFLYQLYKSKKHIPFMVKIRILIIIAIYFYALSMHAFVDNLYLPLIFAIIYLFTALLVYIKTQYNLALAMICIVFLIII